MMSQPSRASDNPRRDAFERHVIPEIDLLLRVALAISANHADAEDLVQETLLRAFRGIDRFDGRHPRAWLLTILRNAHVNRHRRPQPELVPDPEAAVGRLASVPTGPGQPERTVVDEAFDGAVADALAELPPRFRELIRLVDIEGLSYREAAEVLALPIGSVMSRLHRGRRRMKRCLIERGFVLPRGEGQ
jgi:RNA polymerase sigma-70 factor (ECF subfamily)